MTSSATIPPGYVGNLTQDQEAKLQQVWTLLLQAWDANSSSEEKPQDQPSSPQTPSTQHRRLFSLSRTQSQVSSTVTAAGASVIPAKLLSTLKSMNVGSNEINSIQQVLSKLSPEELRSAFLTMAKQDNPDALVLRFLRAEKWDVAKGFVKLVNTLAWRTKEIRVDEDIVPNGELYALQESKKSEKNDGGDFLAQLRMGKSYFHGADKEGRPICVVRVRFHKPGAQSEKALNRYIVHCIEMVRILLVPPVETMVCTNCRLPHAGRLGG